jgi:low density lipoprotein receptor-related protein 5/6
MENAMFNPTTSSPRLIQRLLAGIVICSMAAIATSGGVIYFGEIFHPDRESGSIRKVNTDGTGLEVIHNTGDGVRGVAVDITAGKIYWCDVNGYAIRRSNLDGSEIEDLITDGLEWPRTIALDVDLGRFYWGDQLTAEIRTAMLDGSNDDLVRSTEFHAGLAIDRVNGKVYWTTSILDVEGDILRSNLDGSGVEVVVTGEGKPAGLALDIERGKMYWTDYVLDVIRRSDLDGSNIEEIYAVGSNRNPRCIALDLGERKVYWGQDVDVFGNTGKIMRMDFDGHDPEDVIDGLGLITEITLGETKERLLADMNCDFELNFDDVDPFVLALTSKSDYEQSYPDCSWRLGDVNGDNVVDFDDIDPFVECIVRGSCN